MIPEGLFLAALPEHLLLLGILAILAIDLVSARARDPLLPALVTVTAAAAAAFWLHATGFSAVPFPGHFSVDGDALAGKVLLFGLTVPVLILGRGERLDDPVCILERIFRAAGHDDTEPGRDDI